MLTYWSLENKYTRLIKHVGMTSTSNVNCEYNDFGFNHLNLVVQIGGNIPISFVITFGSRDVVVFIR